MKKILLYLFFALLISCDKNCDGEIKELTEQYKKALGYAGSNSAAIMKLTEDYNKKLTELNNRCD